jgi:hypothetical protein
MHRAQAPKTTLRMPDDVVIWLRQQAAHNVTSMTAEIIRVIRDRMHQDRRAERKTLAAVE